MIPASWIVSGVAVLAASGFVALKKSSYDEGKREEGRKEYRPTMLACTEQLGENKRAFDEITLSMVRIKAASAVAKQAIATAKKQNEARAEIEVERLAEIDAVPSVGSTACEKTSNAIAKVLR